jgi:phage/plasmid-associated DNA primase
VTSNELWAAYKEWCKDAGRHTKHKQRFCQDIFNHQAFKGLAHRRDNVRGYKGVKVLTDAFDAIEDNCPF